MTYLCHYGIAAGLVEVDRRTVLLPGIWRMGGAPRQEKEGCAADVFGKPRLFVEGFPGFVECVVKQMILCPVWKQLHDFLLSFGSMS